MKYALVLALSASLVSAVGVSQEVYSVKNSDLNKTTEAQTDFCKEVSSALLNCKDDVGKCAAKNDTQDAYGCIAGFGGIINKAGSGSPSDPAEEDSDQETSLASMSQEEWKEKCLDVRKTVLKLCSGKNCSLRKLIDRSSCFKAAPKDKQQCQDLLKTILLPCNDDTCRQESKKKADQVCGGDDAVDDGLGREQWLESCGKVFEPAIQYCAKEKDEECTTSMRGAASERCGKPRPKNNKKCLKTFEGIQEVCSNDETCAKNTQETIKQACPGASSADN